MAEPQTRIKIFSVNFQMRPQEDESQKRLIEKTNELEKRVNNFLSTHSQATVQIVQSSTAHEAAHAYHHLITAIVTYTDK